MYPDKTFCAAGGRTLAVRAEGTSRPPQDAPGSITGAFFGGMALGVEDVGGGCYED